MKIECPTENLSVKMHDLSQRKPDQTAKKVCDMQSDLRTEQYVPKQLQRDNNIHSIPLP